MSRSKRKKNFVDGNVQGALLRRIFYHWLSFFGVLGLTVVLMQAMLGDPSEPLLLRIQNETGQLFFLGTIMLCLLPAFMLDTIRFSNRFVGPIIRLKRHLQEVPEGKLERCKFRGDDFWTDLADDFNKVAEIIESQQLEIEKLKHQQAQSV